MDVIRSPRGKKGGRFTKKGEDSTLVLPSNPLLRLATVALATVVVASAQPCLTPSELPRGELARQKRSAVDLMNICSKTSTFEVNDMLDILLSSRVRTVPWLVKLSLKVTHTNA